MLFENIATAPSKTQRGLIRRICQKIKYVGNGEVEVEWSLDILPVVCDSGGSRFDLGTEWGGKWVVSHENFPPLQILDNIKVSEEQPTLSKDVLHQKYMVERLSIKEIAQELGSSEGTVSRKMRDYEIPPRKAGSNLTKKAGLGLAYGQQNRNRQQIANKRELENIEKMKELRLRGFSYWKIADIFNSMKVPTKTKKGKWHARSIKTILDRVLDQK